jgi:hypothetical protein
MQEGFLTDDVFFLITDYLTFLLKISIIVLISRQI